MMILVTVNNSALIRLHQETKLLEHRQIERLNASQTNTTGRAELPLGRIAGSRPDPMEQNERRTFPAPKFGCSKARCDAWFTGCLD